MTRRDVHIRGGGLAGLALGCALQRNGARVTVYEAGEYPRHRVCGEFIAGLDPETLAELGLGDVLLDAQPKLTVAWFRAGRPAGRSRLPRPALGISRHCLDARLAERFVNLGGTLRTKTRVEPPANSAGWIDAAGRRPGSSKWLGLKMHVHGLTPRADLEIHAGPGAYVGMSSVEDGSANVCGLFRLRPTLKAGPDRTRYFLEYLDACQLGELGNRIRHAQPEVNSFCSVAGLRFGEQPWYPPHGGLSLGDAYGMIPPFTGDGMAMAFQSAALATRSVQRWISGELPWDEMCTKCRSRHRRHFRARLACAQMLHPFLYQSFLQRLLGTGNRIGLLPTRILFHALH